MEMQFSEYDFSHLQHATQQHGALNSLMHFQATIFYFIICCRLPRSCRHRLGGKVCGDVIVGGIEINEFILEHRVAHFTTARIE